ncbi:efflux RND transporter permease subunit [Prevotella pallens]|jgi:RND transporter, HAE1 family|uniref:HAE1 family hydrophobic/amphiphilic exporter-1 n=2 Tax=Prevotella pallens TaxID=60133 RepID=A0ABX9DV62_9BACT|nr:efflux RND transporter permease subunit [Prevotella pallens]EGQ19603.1 AcrB/AcrD family multidrug resistance protein [Prevotella pallens ATCC 700821]MBF1450235.1 efflux RND transporter permease subunit [Prevotella pallens]MBF1457825.1 efflux RND transporter permease subunit [Prevotella pallens]MBF1460509.1 efflux RND transporter permease subunit [Prevotella pallens]MBF1462996.1 efflux RND transporter permease subunit [Prevotella pallens]
MTFTNFIKRPVLSTVVSIFFVLLGTIGLISLPIEQYPDIAPPTISVMANYQGADAQTVLNSVVTPLEESINGVENMTYIQSTATNAGSAMITVYFKQGSNPDMAAVNVQNRVSQAQALLPAEVTRAGVTVSKRQSSNVIMYSLTTDNGRYDDEFLTNYNAINIVPLLKRINGVGDVQTPGMKTYSMRIWLKPEKMKQYGLVPSDISAALAEQNIEAAPGSFGEQSNMTYEYTMRYKGRLKTEKEYGDIIISTDNSGQTLHLRDVADVKLGGLMYSVSMLNNGEPSVVGMVQQIAGSNATQIAKDVKAALADAQKSMPPGMKVTIQQDVTEFLFASMEEVIFTLFLTLGLVFLVVYVFLQDFRSTLIPMIAVPVALIGAFFFLWMFGFSINLLTLSALLLAIAIVVDDAIVVVEAVHAKLDLGYKSALTAAIDAMNEISGAIISITLVMAAVFVPVSFMSGTSGTFYREFGVTMAVSIVISAINALTLSPALCAIFLKPHKEEEKKKLSRIDRFHLAFNTQYNKINAKYKKMVERIISNRVITGISVIVGIVALVITMATTKTGLIPDEDTGVLFATISLEPGMSQAETQKVTKQIDAMLKTNPYIERRVQLIGYNFIAGRGSDQATFIIKLKPFEERKYGLFDRIKSVFNGAGIAGLFIDPTSSNMVLGMIYKQTASIKGARVLAFGPPMVPGFAMSNGLTISMEDRTGGDLNKFFTITQEYLKALNARPEISNAQTSYNPNYPQYMVNIDVAKAKQAGTSPAAILSVLQGYYGGMYASNFNAYGKLYRVMIQGTVESRINENGLNDIYVRTKGGMSPVGEFCSLKRIYGPSNIARFNLFTSITINAQAADGYSSGEAIKAVEEVAKQKLPAGYTYEFSGLTRSEQESSNSTGIIFALCLVFVYLILSAQYESYILPLAVILSIPFGLAGAFIFTMLFGHSNDIYMQISLIMLIGLLAKNAILIVEFALERRRTGMAIKYAAILGAGARLRPILMTSLAMVVGLLPLMFASGVGKNGNQTLGAAAVGGMFIGTLCQVFIVPSLFMIFEYLQEKLKPIEFGDEENKQIAKELKPFLGGPASEYEVEE